MRWMMGAVFVVTLVAAARADEPVKAPATEPNAPSCRLLRRASLDMEMDDTGRITVPVTINGTARQMLVDTGAVESMVTVRTIKDLNLPMVTPRNGIRMEGIGRTLGDKVTDIAEFGFGQMKGKNFRFFVLYDLMDSAGLLGPDFLQPFDTDFDFANAKLNLISPDHCPGEVVYWTRGGYGVVPFELEQNHIMLKVQLDGQEIRAGLDTGAADTLMSLERASGAFDLDKDKLAKSSHYPFKTLSFGEVSVSNPAINLMSDDDTRILGHHSRDLQMIIGMGVLRRLHLYISYKEKVIYVTPATQY
jgi:predicted aspartyl protease